MSKIKIALIEDDKAILSLYKIKLKGEGFDVHTAENGLEGLELIENQKPDLILLDLLMPEMNGEEMLIELREKDWGEHIKVIILTNISKDEAPLSLRSLAISDYLVKALYTPTQVVDKINRVLNN